MRYVLVLLCAVLLAGPVHGQCCGDCDGDGAVTIDELVRAVDNALGRECSDDQGARLRELLGDWGLSYTISRTRFTDRVLLDRYELRDGVHYVFGADRDTGGDVGFTFADFGAEFLGLNIGNGYCYSYLADLVGGDLVGDVYLAFGAEDCADGSGPYALDGVRTGGGSGASTDVLRDRLRAMRERMREGR